MGDLIKTNILCTRVIAVFDALDAPVTGLVNADFTTKNLTKDGAVSAIAVTVTEINAGTRPGRYKVDWTPTADGEYELLVAEPTNAPRGFGFSFTATADGPLTLAPIQAATMRLGIAATSWFDKSNEILFASDKQTAAQTDKELVAAPTSRDMAGDVVDPDPDVEYIIVGIEASALAAGTFYLENADGGAAAQKSILYQHSATFVMGMTPTWLPMGKGLPIKYTNTGTNPTLSIRIAYIRKKTSYSR